MWLAIFFTTSAARVESGAEALMRPGAKQSEKYILATPNPLTEPYFFSTIEQID
jgi:hypothetical protein